MKESAEGARREKPAIKDEWFTDPRVSEAAEALRTAQAALDALEASEGGAGAEGVDAVRERVRSAHEHMARVWEEVSADKWHTEAPAENLAEDPVDPVEAARAVYHAKRAEYSALKEEKGADDPKVLALKKLLPGFAAKIAAAGRKAKKAEAGTAESADVDAEYDADIAVAPTPEPEVPLAQPPGTELVPAGDEEAIDADAGGLADVHARLSEELAGVHRALASIERAADARGGADPSAEAEKQQFLARREQLTAALARIAARAADMAEQGGEQPRKRATRPRASTTASATGSANTGKLDEMADDQAGFAPHPQDVAEERQRAVRRRRAEKSAEKTAEWQGRHEGAAQQETGQEQRSAPEQEQSVRTGLFSDYGDRISLYFESRRLGKDARELERKSKRLATLEEELAALTGELDADDEELQGIRRRHKLPDRAALWRAKDEETLKRKEDRLRAQIDEARREVELLQRRVEAREKSGVEIVERAAKRADAIIAPQQAQFTEVAKQVDEANDALARYRGMLEVTEREIAEMTDRQNNVTGVSAKKELAYLLQRREVMRKRLKHHIDTWSVRVARLTEGRDRLGSRIAERAGVVEGMKQTLENAAHGGTSAEQTATAASHEAPRPRSPELARGDAGEFMRVWNGRYGESLPLDADDLSNLISSEPTYREIETAARLRLGWKRGFMWKLPILSWLWNFRTNRKLRQMRSDFLKQPR